MHGGSQKHYHSELVSDHGKHTSAKMAELSFEKMKIPKSEWPNLEVITMGDHLDDLKFSYNIRQKLKIDAHPIHINAIKLSEDTTNHFDKQMKDLLTPEGNDSFVMKMQVRRVHNYNELTELMKTDFGVSPNIERVENLGQQPNWQQRMQERAARKPACCVVM